MGVFYASDFLGQEREQITRWVLTITSEGDKDHGLIVHLRG
jgi:hypothetical protein